MMEQNIADIDTYASYAQKYAWPVVALMVSPVVSWRFMQWVKLRANCINGFKPSPIILDFSGFMIVVGITYYSWMLYAENALLVALLVGFMHTSIVKLIFAYAPEKIVNALAYGTVDKKLAPFVGKDRRATARNDIDTESPADPRENQ